MVYVSHLGMDGGAVSGREHPVSAHRGADRSGPGMRSGAGWEALSVSMRRAIGRAGEFEHCKLTVPPRPRPRPGRSCQNQLQL